MKRMKKIILYAMGLLALTFGSCQQDSEPIPGIGKNSFNLKVEIDNIGTGMQTDTRAMIVDPVTGEEKVAGLYLLFFEKTSDGSGKYKHFVKVNDGNEITTGTDLAVNFEGANSGSYTILALANAESYFIDSSTGTLEDFLNSTLTTSMTEADVIKQTMLYTGASITKDKLIMSGSAEKNDGEQLVTLKLTRAVSRFDVQNLDSEYNLASVSIFNKAQYTPLWLSTGNASVKPPVTVGKFYGVSAGGSQEIKGGLYTLENYISNPAMGDNFTTCLVIGLEKGGTTHYYRVNVNPEESGQSLKRNYVYQVSVRNVLGDGATSEDDAYTSGTDPNLDYDINNWNLDDEGMILTDGKNTLAIPSKIIRFTQEGGKRSYTIFTQGEGTLTMNPSLPNGFSASLSGNSLTIVADALGTLKKREGTLDLAFAGLKGTVQIIQEPKESHFLRLDVTSLKGFSATSGSAVDQFITINSSADWIAKVYNTGGSDFVISGNNTGQSGEALTITVGSDNATNKVLTGFVLVSLEDIPGYSRVVMLKQSTLGGISIDLGSLNALDFKANGTPKSVLNGVSGDAYEFIVDPGTDDDGNFNVWNAVLTGADADKFKLVVEKENGINRVTVYPWNESATGNLRYFNLSANKISGVELKVYSGSNPNVTDPRLSITVPVSQDALIFNVVTTSIPKTGGERLVEVELSEGLTWTATIKDNKAYEDNTANKTKYAEAALGHPKGYILNGSDELSNIGDKVEKQSENLLKVKFNRLLFPQVNITPTLELEIQVDGLDDATADANGLVKTVEVTQEKLLPKNVNIADINGHPHYAVLKDGSYMDDYRAFINSTDLFGNTSSAKCYANGTPLIQQFQPRDLTPIADTYTYVHAGSSKHKGTAANEWSSTTYTTVNNWRLKNDGITVYIQDEYSRDAHEFFSNAPFNNVAGAYSEVVPAAAMTNSRKFDGNNSNIMNYLLTDGPFGEVDSSYGTSLGGVDATHSAITKTSLEALGGVAVITESNSDNVIVGINPIDKLLFIGEIQLFYDSRFKPAYINEDGTSSVNKERRNHSRFFANLMSYIIRSAQYGSHFTDHFVRTNDGSNWQEATTYPFGILKTTNAEPMF